MGKRIIYCEEPPTNNAKVDGGLLKEWRGGGSFSARPLYGSNVQLIPTATLFILTNEMVAATKADEALSSSLITMHLPSTFTDIHSHGKFHFPMDKDLVHGYFGRRDYKMALLDELTVYLRKYVDAGQQFVPQKSEYDNTGYLMSETDTDSDILWKLVEFGDIKKDFVYVKELHMQMKEMKYKHQRGQMVADMKLHFEGNARVKYVNTDNKPRFRGLKFQCGGGMFADQFS
jgi:phage/plasmid-associated DNA primase